ncbi:malectin domain-containing carbohydrate-binding protein [Humibacillus sp. DSM 29435]|uniref:malectin domain-containing carbohydrate-binding protein n=1 Tax=Humibacillus sp. DSM 29435 TaxID=1869167 RepID=UPI0015866A03|nr:malectin domain-containing carbohydrate-binding protein [Humibacillus sp. DSM 29435]
MAGATAVAATLAVGLGAPSLDTAQAAAGRNDVPSAVPAAFTPGVNNGQVRAIAQVGSTMVVGGTFSSVSASGSTAVINRTRVFAFDAGTGAISSFAPNVNGNVETVAAGPTAGTVYIGGSFTSVNGVKAPRIALLSLSNGQAVTTFKPGAGFNGIVQRIRTSGGRLFVGGSFTKYQSFKHVGLATLDPATGNNDPYMNLNMAGRHNDTGSGRVEKTGALDFDISGDGSQMAVIGNFRTVGTEARTQLALVSLGATSATVRTDFKTNDYEPLCYNSAFDTTVRKVMFAPSGSWFVVTATGGGNSSLCDAASRFETNASGQDLHPTWISHAGGDTLYGLAVTDEAVFLGGHQRWMNNQLGNDSPGPGAVPRPGLAAVAADTGLPLSWNPGRNPRGAGAYSLLATDAGIWVGSDTPWIGNHKYKRPRIAFFPYTGGYNLPSTAEPSLTGLRVGGQVSPGSSPVLYRVDAGGATVAANDGGPDWAADQSDPSPVRNSGSNSAGYAPVPNVDSTVPASTPSAIFDSERWDPSGGDEMAWSFPVAAGHSVKVRLYFANRCTCTSAEDSRQFNVAIDGNPVLSNFDIVKSATDQTGTMREFTVTSDGAVDIGFGHITENPLVNGIEIIDPSVPTVAATVTDAVTQTAYDGSTVGATTTVNGGGIDWSNTRGAFVIGGSLFYAKANGLLYRRTVSGTTYGPEVVLNPYHDPLWMNISNGSGGTYNGTDPNLAAQLPSLTGLFFDNSRIYYSTSGDPRLHYRSFNADSGIVYPIESFAPTSLDFSTVTSMTLNGGRLYYVRTDGQLWSVAFSNGAVSGTPSLVDNPAVSGHSWTGRSLFAAPNQ